MSKYQEYRTLANVLVKMGFFLMDNSKRVDNFKLHNGWLLVLDKDTGTFKIIK